MRLALFLLLVGCGAAPQQDPSPKKTSDDAGTAMMTDDASTTKLTMSDVQPIFDTYCVRCHASRVPVLLSSVVSSSLSKSSSCGQMPYIVPGHPEQSFLYYKIGGETTLSPSGISCREKMPTDGALVNVDPDAAEKIRAWIESGAE